jgi:shikimate dehydrogenase
VSDVCSDVCSEFSTEFSTEFATKHSMNQIAHYAVIGHPVAHSKSPQIHAEFARLTGQHMDYQRLLAPWDGFESTVQGFVAGGGRGLNVTLPFKQQAWAMLALTSAPSSALTAASTVAPGTARLTSRAAAAEAVNTLHFGLDGTVLGDNTDGPGLVRDLSHNLGFALSGRRVLLLGAGGAARGVIQPLLAAGVRSLHVANRDAARAEALVMQLRASLSASLLESLPEPGATLAAEPPLHALALADLAGAAAQPFDLIINATSASLSDDLPPLPVSVYGSETLAYDMMYGRQPTVFMQSAQQHGASVRDGLGMLVEQAAEAFLLWRGVRPATADVFASLRQQLSQ